MRADIVFLCNERWKRLQQSIANQLGEYLTEPAFKADSSSQLFIFEFKTNGNLMVQIDLEF